LRGEHERGERLRRHRRGRAGPLEPAPRAGGGPPVRRRFGAPVPDAGAGARRALPAVPRVSLPFDAGGPRGLGRSGPRAGGPGVALAGGTGTVTTFTLSSLSMESRVDGFHDGTDAMTSSMAGRRAGRAEGAASTPKPPRVAAALRTLVARPIRVACVAAMLTLPA